MTNRSKKEDICSCSFDVFVAGGDLRVFILCHLDLTFQIMFLFYVATKCKDNSIFFFFLNQNVAAKKLKMQGSFFDSFMELEKPIFEYKTHQKAKAIVNISSLQLKLLKWAGSVDRLIFCWLFRRLSLKGDGIIHNLYNVSCSLSRIHYKVFVYARK